MTDCRDGAARDRTGRELEGRLAELEKIVEHLAERVKTLEATVPGDGEGGARTLGVLEAAHQDLAERIKAQRRSA